MTPSEEPPRLGLTTSGKPSVSSSRPSASAAPNSRKAVWLKANQSGVGSPVSRDRVLGQDLVHAAGAGGGAGTGEGDAEDLQQLLHGAVLAADAVHGDEGDVGPLGDQALDQVGADVDRQHLVAEPLQRVLDPRPRAQRDAPLQRPPAFEDRDLHASSALRNGSTFGAGSSAGSGNRCSPVSVP